MEFQYNPIISSSLQPQGCKPQIGLLWNCQLWGKKLLGGWPYIGLLFICLPAAAFFFKVTALFCQLRKFWAYWVSRTFFSSMSGIAIWMENNQNSQQSNYVSARPLRALVLIILRLKCTQIWKWLLDKIIGYYEVTCHGQKDNLLWFWQHWASYWP